MSIKIANNDYNLVIPNKAKILIQYATKNFGILDNPDKNDKLLKKIIADPKIFKKHEDCDIMDHVTYCALFICLSPNPFQTVAELEEEFLFNGTTNEFHIIENVLSKAFFNITRDELDEKIKLDERLSDLEKKQKATQDGMSTN